MPRWINVIAAATKLSLHVYFGRMTPHTTPELLGRICSRLGKYKKADPRCINRRGVAPVLMPLERTCPNYHPRNAVARLSYLFDRGGIHPAAAICFCDRRHSPNDGRESRWRHLHVQQLYVSSQHIRRCSRGAKLAVGWHVRCLPDCRR
jgi:hypothetical protein